jgi:hypothetical protein
MTSYAKEIVVGSAIVAALGVAAYMARPTPIQLTASALHAKAWGKQWPQSKGTIYKTELSDDKTGSDDDDESYGLADKLHVPPNLNYRYFKEIRSLKSALGVNPGQDFEDILVVREEYEKLHQALEDLKNFRSIVVTGHPGIG